MSSPHRNDPDYKRKDSPDNYDGYLERPIKRMLDINKDKGVKPKSAFDVVGGQIGAINKALRNKTRTIKPKEHPIARHKFFISMHSTSDKHGNPIKKTIGNSTY